MQVQQLLEFEHEGEIENVTNVEEISETDNDMEDQAGCSGCECTFLDCLVSHMPSAWQVSGCGFDRYP